MIIAIDLDEVLCDFISSMLFYYNEKYGTNYKKEDFFTYNFWEVLGISQEKTIDIVHDFHKTHHFEDIQPINGAIEAVSKLKKNHKLIVITSRQHSIENQTRKWIEKYFPNTFDEIILANHFAKNGTSKKKKYYCDKFKVDVLIEDNIHYANECISKHTKVFLFDYPWNRSNTLNKDVTRVYSWDELVNKLNFN